MGFNALFSLANRTFSKSIRSKYEIEQTSFLLNRYIECQFRHIICDNSLRVLSTKRSICQIPIARQSSFIDFGVGMELNDVEPEWSNIVLQ